MGSSESGPDDSSELEDDSSDSDELNDVENSVVVKESSDDMFVNQGQSIRRESSAPCIKKEEDSHNLGNIYDGTDSESGSNDSSIEILLEQKLKSIKNRIKVENRKVEKIMKPVERKESKKETMKKVVREAVESMGQPSRLSQLIEARNKIESQIAEELNNQSPAVSSQPSLVFDEHHAEGQNSPSARSRSNNDKILQRSKHKGSRKTSGGA